MTLSSVPPSNYRRKTSQAPFRSQKKGAEGQPDRAARRYDISRDDQRDLFERDRDRILYSSAFRCLAGITQIVRAGEADVFHTRQQHTMKVAQVGRRLAQHVIRKQPALAQELGVDVEVVEAACDVHSAPIPCGYNQNDERVQ